MYADRVDAGRRLARAIADTLTEELTESVVLGLPRGGVPVAAEIARALGRPLDVLVVRKVGAPDDPEFALGAVGEDGVVVLDADVIRRLRVTDQVMAELVAEQRRAVDARTRSLRERFPRLTLSGRTAIVVDDGLATGSTAAAAVEVAREHGAARIVVAAPVGSVPAVERLAAICDVVVCPERPHWFASVGNHYEDFSQVTDDEVLLELQRARDHR